MSQEIFSKWHDKSVDTECTRKIVSSIPFSEDHTSNSKTAHQLMGNVVQRPIKVLAQTLFSENDWRAFASNLLTTSLLARVNLHVFALFCFPVRFAYADPFGTLILPKKLCCSSLPFLSRWQMLVG